MGAYRVINTGTINKLYPNSFIDIFEKETRKQLVSLFYKKRLKKVRWIAAFLLIPAIIILNSYFVKAGVSYFYSPLCLGSWKNVRNIEGEPELSFGADISNFNNANSAFLKNSSGQIFCGKFNSSSPPDNPIQSLRLRFSLAVVSDIIPEINAQDFQKGDTLDLNDESSEKAIFIIQESSPQISEPEITPSPEKLSPSSTPELDSTSLPQATPEPILTPEIAPTSTLTPVLEPAEPSTTSTPEPMPENSIEPTPEPSVFNLKSLFINYAQAEEPQPEEISGPIASLNLDDILEVSYTVDGENWITLGRINRESWENISFDISNVALENVDNLQIAVSSLPTLGSDITVYMDSVWLEAEYDSSFVSFVKDIGETIIDTLTLQNLEPSVEDTNLSKEPEPTPRVKVKKTKYDFREKDVSNSSLELKWYPADKVNELSRANIGSAQVQTNQKTLEISGSCRLSYFVILLYRNKDDYIESPASAMYNVALPCDGKFNYVVSEFPSHIDSGDYYILIAEQGDGPWRPISDLYKIKIDKEIIEEEAY